MSIWIKRLFVILSVGGGVTGMVFMSTLFSQAGGRVAVYGLIVLMIAMFGFGVFAGLRFIEEEEKGLRMLRWFFAAQTPIVSSPFIGYQLISGFGITISWIGDKMGFFWRFGSEMGVWLFQDRPWGIGVNAFALFMLLWIGRLLKRKEKADQVPEPTLGGVTPAADAPVAPPPDVAHL